MKSALHEGSGIVVTGARKAFGPRVLWEDIDLAVAPGQLVALLGTSGSGKTTLLNAVGGLERLDRGTVHVAGRDVGRLRAGGRRRLRRDVLGFVFQNYALVENSTVRSNLAVVYPRPGMARRVRADMEQALDRVGLPNFVDRRVSELSGGERQRVALARLLLKKPHVVLADEPTGSLDEENARIVIDLLRGMARDGAAVLVVTHDPAVAQASDQVVVLGATSPPLARD